VPTWLITLTEWAGVWLLASIALATGWCLMRRRHAKTADKEN
jgi:hypothetical protein